MELNKMVNLIKNENMKLAHKLSTLVMIGILVLITIIFGLVFKFGFGDTSTNHWKQNLAQDNIDYQKTIDKSGTPKGVKTNLRNKIKVNEYRIQNNKRPVEDRSLWGFVSGATGAISFISLFTIIIGSGIVANEFSNGTIKLLLIRPSKRWKILLSKYLTVMGYALFMLCILFVTSFLLGGILFGFKGVNEPFIKYANGHITEVNMIAHTMGVYGLKCIDLVMMVSLAFMISTVFRNSGIAIGIGVFLLTIGSTITGLLAQFFTWPKYILFANTDLSQYLNGTPLIDGMTMTFSIIVIIIYFIIFNAISFLGFIKRDVAA